MKKTMKAIMLGSVFMLLLATPCQAASFNFAFTTGGGSKQEVVGANQLRTLIYRCMQEVEMSIVNVMLVYMEEVVEIKLVDMECYHI